jgi:hypothetical protein
MMHLARMSHISDCTIKQEANKPNAEQQITFQMPCFFESQPSSPSRMPSQTLTTLWRRTRELVDLRE